MSVRLEFGEDEMRLSVSDDGIGLPGDYAERGHGFVNMGRDARAWAGGWWWSRKGTWAGLVSPA